MEKEISFTQEVKEEITSQSFSTTYLKSLLAAFIKINGSIKISNKSTNLVLRTENAKIAKFMYSSIQNIYDVQSRFSYSRTMNFHKRTTYSVIIETKVSEILDDLCIDLFDTKINKIHSSNDKRIAGYLCGSFLASGSVNSPANSNYHLEVSANDESYAKWFIKLVNKYEAVEFNPKVIARRNQFVIYIKRSDLISSFLVLIGATESALNFESVRVDRELSNIENRLSNLDEANYKKTSDTAKKQLDDITVVDAILGIEHLDNEKLTNLCLLRIQNEDASMSELASLMSETMGYPVSRSNIAHMFNRIHVLANKFKGESDDK